MSNRGSTVNHPTREGFWSWAYDNLLTNITRGVLAEYLVACELGLVETPRQVWEDYDLYYKGIKIEVKSSAYVQDWEQNDKLYAPQFDIQNRKCNVYVFCLLAEEDETKIDPLIVGQWKFCVVDINKIKSLDKGNRIQKTIRKNPIEYKLAGNWIEHNELKQAIEHYVQ